MSMKLIKRKLKRRGEELYNKYFFNPEHVITEIVNQYDNNLLIDESICCVIFDTINTSQEQIQELIMYYPNKLKEYKYITDDVINNIYNEFGDCINLMNEYKTTNNKSIRLRLHNGAYKRSKDTDIVMDITSEDIKLNRYCPYLGVEIEYGNNEATKYSASLDRIDPTKGYIKNNIEVISLLANRMKNSATQQELITFSKNVLKMRGEE